MIEPAKVAVIERLLVDAALSHRKIAKIVGVSRATVSGIANGTRPDYSNRVSRGAMDEPGGPIIRCPGCGGRVYSPCQLCRVRRIVAQEKTKIARSASTCKAAQPQGKNW